jgi:hypothetical protein
MPPFFHLGGSPNDGNRFGFEDGVKEIYPIHEAYSVGQSLQPSANSGQEEKAKNKYSRKAYLGQWNAISPIGYFG